MAQTFAQLQKQIADLEAQAQRLKSSEVPRVIEQVRELVATYGLTAEDVFGPGKKRSREPRSSGSRAKYADANGNTWVGMGKRPQWIRDALADGRSLEEFTRGAESQRAAVKPPAAKKATLRRRKGAGKAKYSDGNHSWSGFGPQPRWLKESLAGGRTLDEFQV